MVVPRRARSRSRSRAPDGRHATGTAAQPRSPRPATRSRPGGAAQSRRRARAGGIGAPATRRGPPVDDDVIAGLSPGFHRYPQLAAQEARLRNRHPGRLRPPSPGRRWRASRTAALRPAPGGPVPPVRHWRRDERPEARGGGGAAGRDPGHGARRRADGGHHRRHPRAAARWSGARRASSPTAGSGTPRPRPRWDPCFYAAAHPAVLGRRRGPLGHRRRRSPAAAGCPARRLLAGDGDGVTGRTARHRRGCRPRRPPSRSSRKSSSPRWWPRASRRGPLPARPGVAARLRGWLTEINRPQGETMKLRSDPATIRGSIAPVVSPFTAGGKSTSRAAGLVGWQIESGSHGISLGGSTGEPGAQSAGARGRDPDRGRRDRTGCRSCPAPARRSCPRRWSLPRSRRTRARTRC